MMGINPRLIELLQVANSRNLGEINPLNIEIDGELKKIHGFRVPKNGIVQKIIKMAVPHAFNFASVTPVVNHKKCKICKKCVEVCPVSAMKIKINIRKWIEKSVFPVFVVMNIVRMEQFLCLHGRWIYLIG